MSIPSYLSGEVRQLKKRREEMRAILETSLSASQARGETSANPQQKALMQDFRKLEANIKRAESELARAGDPGGQIFGQRGQPGNRKPNTAGQLSPLGFPEEELRRMQAAAMRHESCRIETRAFSTADALLPASLFPQVIAAQHEAPHPGPSAGYRHRHPQH